MRFAACTVVSYILVAAPTVRTARAQVGTPEFSARAAPADLQRPMPANDTLTLGLFDPVWRLGIFSVSANPAGLPWELAPARHEFTLRRDFEQGTYRRPLDPPAVRATAIEANGWQPVTPNGAMIGRIVVNQQRFAPGPFADQTNVYTSDPFATADTSSSALTVLDVAMDGSAGWAVGNTALGLTLGYETRDAHTLEAAFVRRERAVVPGVIAGVARHLRTRTGTARLTLGARAGWRGGAETVDLVDRAQSGRVIEFAGLTEPRSIIVSDIDPTYYHRFAQTSGFAGASAAADVHDVRFAMSLDAGHGRYRDWTVESDHPPMNRWTPRSVRAIAGVQYDSRWGLVELGANWRSLTGTANQASDSIGKAFETRGHDARAWGVLRTPLYTTWAAALAFSFVDRQYSQADTLPGIVANLRSRTPALHVSAGWKFLNNVFAEGGFALSRVAVRGAIPSLRGRGSAYSTYIAPELELYATPARQNALHGAISWCIARDTRLWFSASSSTGSPESRIALTDAPPTGTRRLTSIALGVTMSPHSKGAETTSSRERQIDCTKFEPLT